MNISVIIPVYNAEKYISQAVESALQFPEVSEIILVEDKSPDNALEVCKSLSEKHSRVKLFQHPDQGNHGAGASRNLGLQMAVGEFIAFLDADDYYLPNRFDAEKELFKNQEVEGVYGALGTHYYTEKAREQYFPVYGDRLVTVYKTHSPEEVFPGQMGLRGAFGLFSIDCLTFRKSCLYKIGGLMKTNLKLHQDTEFLFRLSYYCKLHPGILDEAVAMRGVHESNRISQVDSGKVKPASTRVHLWKEIENWASNETSMPEDYLQHIVRMHRSYQIGNAPTLKKLGMIGRHLITDYKSIHSGMYNRNFRKELLRNYL